MKKSDIFKIKKEKYVKTVKRDYPPFYSSLMIGSSADEKIYQDVIKTPYSRRDIVCLDYIWYYYKADEIIGKKIIVKEWNSKKAVARIKKVFSVKEKKLLASVNKDTNTFFEEFRNYMPSMNLIYFGEIFYDLAKNILIKKVGKNNAAELLNLIRLPLKDNFYKKEELNLLTAKNLKKHVKKYEWIYSRYGDERAYSLAEAREKLKNINKAKFLKEYKKNKKKLKTALAEAKKIIGKDKSHIIDIMQYIIFYRTQRTDIMNIASYFYIPKLKAEARRRGLTYKELLFCTKDEFLLGKIPPKAEIKKRMKSHVVVEINGVGVCYTGKIYNFLKKVFQEDGQQIKEFKGFIASRGYIKGRVKIVSSREDFKKVRTGDILVSPMTTPEMLPLMHKAAGFITDEGGITSHAAIVSREMNKPCIIGTKIATSVLHDGDLVEVDANKGIVKKLK
ncbi:MAG: PEP-utilizing enzyme [Patescibacteria group bacterium]|jgi:phosphohistidine swiveling domain-containing protein